MLKIQKSLSPAFYALLSLPATAMGFALCVQISALSWILSTKYGLEIHEVGYVWLAGPLAGIIAQPIVGLVSDKVWFWGGRRRPFILIGGVLAGLMILALPFLGVLSSLTGLHVIWVAIGVALTIGYAGILFWGQTPAALCAGMAVVGIGWASTVSLPFAIMSNNVDKNRMGFFMGIFNLSVVIPQLIVSAAIGNVVAAATDKSLVFGIASSSLAVSAVLWFTIRESEMNQPPEVAATGH